MDWTEYYKLPLKLGNNRGLSINGKVLTAINFYQTDTKLQQDIIDCINGEKKMGEDVYERIGASIYRNGLPILIVGGWQTLRYTWRVSSKDAGKIQEDFAEYILNKLNGK